jgi:large subunit ribosomal protein L25
MKSVSVSGSVRPSVGKKDAKAIRANGEVPCVLYGGEKQLSFTVKYNDLLPVVYTPNVFQIDLNIEGATYPAIIKDIQFHAVNDKMLHIDFLELVPSKSVVISIPVKNTGNSVGVKQGGKLVSVTRKLKVKALPANLPDFIEVKVDDLDIGKAVRVGDLALEGVTLLDEPNRVVTAVRTTRAAIAASQQAEAAAKKK